MNLNKEIYKMFLTRMIRSMFTFKIMEYTHSYCVARTYGELTCGWIDPYLVIMRGDDRLWDWLDTKDGEIKTVNYE